MAFWLIMVNQYSSLLININGKSILITVMDNINNIDTVVNHGKSHININIVNHCQY